MFFDRLHGKTDEEIRVWIAGLVREKQHEDLFRDYKIGIDLDQEKNKLELVKDVTAFANTEGGALLIGIDEEVQDGRKTGVPKPEYGIARISELETRVRDILETGATPRLPSVMFREVSLEGDKYVYVIAHQKSSSRPHMAMGYGDKRYYKRSGNRSVPLEHAEIQDLFEKKLRSAKTVGKYVKELDDGSTLIKRDQERLTLKMLVLPLPLTEGLVDLFGETGKELWLGRNFWQPSGGGHAEWKPCSNGVVLHQHGSSADESSFIAKLHPTGALSYTQQIMNERFFTNQIHIQSILDLVFGSGLREFMNEHLKKIPYEGDVLIYMSTENLRVPVRSGLMNRLGESVDHPEYLKSELKAETVTNSQELK